jgi:hypothetical protein
MATALGATALATSWFLDRVPARERPSEPPPPPPELPPVDPPATLDLLARLVSLLAGSTTGLTLPELRLRLTTAGASVDSLQRALATGLRAKHLRRLGAHNKLRYVLNG